MASCPKVCMHVKSGDVGNASAGTGRGVGETQLTPQLNTQDSIHIEEQEQHRTQVADGRQRRHHSTNNFLKALCELENAEGTKDAEDAEHAEHAEDGGVEATERGTSLVNDKAKQGRQGYCNIKPIPGIQEVDVRGPGIELDQELEGEAHGEEVIGDEQKVLLPKLLWPRLKHHRDNVKADESSDEQVEPLLRCDLHHGTLESRRECWQIPSQLIHGHRPKLAILPHCRHGRLRRPTGYEALKSSNIQVGPLFRNVDLRRNRGCRPRARQRTRSWTETRTRTRTWQGADIVSVGRCERDWLEWAGRQEFCSFVAVLWL
mmetsp:Transcript_9760/g.22388  ORF Transcript_9760/g.22388 Transcript_9760/m.22388 type:complete len:318 (+) Transcript_9760:1491-2444(+)